MKKNYLILLAIILNSTISYGDHHLRDKVGAASSEYLANRFMNGAYMFCDDDGVIEEGAKGVYSLESNKKLDPSQQMPIASATKTMTAAGIMKLRDRGLLNVHDSIAKHLTVKSGIWQDGKIPVWANEVKIHNLLTHRSGLSEYFMEAKLDITKPHAEINKDIANFAANKELSCFPGKKYNYNNTNFVILGLIIEQVSGKELGDFYNEEFFIPLGMKNTKLITLDEALRYQQDPKAINFPTRYFVTPTGADPQFNEVKSEFIMTPFADGGVASTTSDLILWNKALHTGKVISEDSYKLMIERHYEVQGRVGVKNYVGYGLYISELDGGDIVYHHSGNALAIRSESGYIPAKNLYYAVLSNVMNYIPKELKGEIDMNKVDNQLDIHYFTQHIFKAIR